MSLKNQPIYKADDYLNFKCIVSIIIIFTVKIGGGEQKEGQKTENQEVLLKVGEIRNRNLQISLKVIKLEYGNHCGKVTSGLICPIREHLPLGISASGRNSSANMMSSCSSHSKLSSSNSSYAMFPRSSSYFKDAAVLNGEIKALTTLKANTAQFSPVL